MAEGWARALHPERIDAFSAGIDPKGIDPRAVQVMSEAGIDISLQHSKHLDALAGVSFDVVITVCGHANESCPVFPGRVQRLHAGFEDPPRLARDAASEEEALEHYRRVRDEIRRYVEKLPELLGGALRIGWVREKRSEDRALGIDELREA
jgi:arsenate reductase